MVNRIASATLAIAFALIAVQAQTADAQVVPIKGSGTNSSYDPISGDYHGVGIASHMGQMSFSGNVVSNGKFFPAPGIFFSGTFVGKQTNTAANGDSYFLDISGDVVLSIDPVTGLVSGIWLVDWTITGGTGRFEGVTGALKGAAINPPFNPLVTPWSFDWYFSGTMNLGKR